MSRATSGLLAGLTAACSVAVLAAHASGAAVTPSMLVGLGVLTVGSVLYDRRYRDRGGDQR
jgi:hypothetical protein